MIAVVNRDIRVEQNKNGANVILKITPYDQRGRDAEPVVVEAQYSTVCNLALALAQYIQLQEQ